MGTGYDYDASSQPDRYRGAGYDETTGSDCDETTGSNYGEARFAVAVRACDRADNTAAGPGRAKRLSHRNGGRAWHSVLA